MFKIDPVTRNIVICRGDKAVFPLFINEGTAWRPVRYRITEYDTVYLGIMEPGQNFENAIVKKVFNYYNEKNEDGDLIITLNPLDTLHLRPGKYYYAVKLKSLNPETFNVEGVTTVVPDTLFNII